MLTKRTLIAKEIELGFLNLPRELVKQLPKKRSVVFMKESIPFLIDGIEKSLTYNSKYGRVFGLTSFYRSHKAAPKDWIEIVSMGDNKWSLTFHKLNDEQRNLAPISVQEAEEILDVSEVSTQVKGNIVEQRVSELILLYGQGLFNVYKPISDVEGIDLIVVKKDTFKPVFIQVKSKYKLRGKLFQIGVKQKNFKAHHSFFIVGAYFNPQKMDIDDYLVFIPSGDFEKLATQINNKRYGKMYVMTLRFSPEYKGKFSQYLVKKENLVNKVIQKFDEIERYLK